jgi:hypothetical protein
MFGLQTLPLRRVVMDGVTRFLRLPLEVGASGVEAGNQARRAYNVTRKAGAKVTISSHQPQRQTISDHLQISLLDLSGLVNLMCD